MSTAASPRQTATPPPATGSGGVPGWVWLLIAALLAMAGVIVALVRRTRSGRHAG